MHTDSTAGQGLVALAAARLLHLPLTGVVQAGDLRPSSRPADIGARLQRRLRLWFYRRLDGLSVPSRTSARALAAAGVDPLRITVTLPDARPGADAGGPGAAD